MITNAYYHLFMINDNIRCMEDLFVSILFVIILHVFQTLKIIIVPKRMDKFESIDN